MRKTLSNISNGMIPTTLECMMENFEVDWPMVTTLDPLDVEVKDILSPASSRTFIWTLVTSLVDRHRKRYMLEEAGLDVIICLPCWYLLACKPTVPMEDRVRLVRGIYGAICMEDPEFRGKMFGYYPDRIKWYTEEWAASKIRVREYLEMGEKHD